MTVHAQLVSFRLARQPAAEGPDQATPQATKVETKQVTRQVIALIRLQTLMSLTIRESRIIACQTLLRI